MTLPFDDPYTSTFAGQPDTHSYVSSSWKDARRILALPDSAITELPARKNGLRTFVVDGATVSYPHGQGKRYVCFRHTANDCSHTRRVQRFMEAR